MPKKTDDKVIEKAQARILKMAGRKSGLTPPDLKKLPGTDYLKALAFEGLKKSKQLEAKRCNPKDARKVSYHAVSAAA